MWNVLLADDSQEMSRLIFSEKKNKKVECCLLQILLGTLMVNISQKVIFPRKSYLTFHSKYHPWKWFEHNFQAWWEKYLLFLPSEKVENMKFHQFSGGCFYSVSSLSFLFLFLPCPSLSSPLLSLLSLVSLSLGDDTKRSIRVDVSLNPNSIKFTSFQCFLYLSLTLVLLNSDIPCLCKQCRSRSVGFWRSQLIWICTVWHSVFEFVSTTWIR